MKKLNYKIILIHSVYWIHEFHWMFIEEWNIWQFVLFYPIYIGIFYLNYFILIPKVIKVPNFKSILTWFFIFFILYAGRRYLSHYIGYNYFQNWGLIDIYKEPLDYGEIWKGIILGLIGNISTVLAVTFGSMYVLNKVSLEKLQNKKIQHEVSTFKNQIDISETIIILEKLQNKSRVNASAIQEEIIQLSSVLRYHLYSKEPNVMLSKELEIVDNQLKLYNKLNKGKIQLFKQIQEGYIKTGILSKTIGEILKHAQVVKTVLELYKKEGGIFLKILDEDKLYLDNLHSRFRGKFGEQLKIQTNNNNIIIQLN